MTTTIKQPRTALITGASKGLGKAMAVALAREGVQVALVSRNLELLQQAAAEIKNKGGVAEVFTADVTVESEVEKLKADVLKRFPRVDILINNAGINIRKAIHEFTLDEWMQVQNTNVTSAFLVCRAFVPQMKGAGYGRIINMTSIMSHVAIAGRTAYAASKSALLGLTKALALELVTEGITVNGISPGPFATELNQPILQNKELNAAFIAKIPVGRWGRVEEVADLAVYLCSENAGFITGTDILIDGGWTAQ